MALAITVGSCQPAAAIWGASPGKEAAARELREETGLEAANWMPLLDLALRIADGSPRAELPGLGFEGVEREPEPQEVIRLQRVTFHRAVEMAITGEIRDAGTVAAILATYIKAVRRELPPELLQRIL